MFHVPAHKDVQYPAGQFLYAYLAKPAAVAKAKVGMSAKAFDYGYDAVAARGVCDDVVAAFEVR